MSIRTFSLSTLAIVAMSGLTAFPVRSQSAGHRENGWYRIIDGQKDSIAPRPVVTVKDFAELRLEKDFFGNDVITGQVCEHKLKAWADSTEQLIGKRLGFVFNDTVITAPRVNGRIESGAFQISNPRNYDMLSLYESLMKEKKDSTDALLKAKSDIRAKH